MISLLISGNLYYRKYSHTPEVSSQFHRNPLFYGQLLMIDGSPEASTSRRIMLLNPTKYLGNLLIAGGLIQTFAAWCRQHGREFVLVLDASFEELCAAAFPGVTVFYYPRQEIRRAKPWRKAVIFFRFVRRLRGFRADLAFNIEDDSLTSRLTQLSGAACRIGCNPSRQALGFEKILPIAYGQRPAASRHRWHSYLEVFMALGLPTEPCRKYIDLHIDQQDEALIQKLAELGRRSDAPLVVLHPSATKDYKKWPESAFTTLSKLLKKKGFQVALIGAGPDDAERCAYIAAEVEASGLAGPLPLNLCNQLSLRQLAALFRMSDGIVGNDSGPSHLASAQGVPGLVVFGPSDPDIWGPMGSATRVLRKAELCAPECSRRQCHAGYRCLREITPSEVLDALTAQLALART